MKSIKESIRKHIAIMEDAHKPELSLYKAINKYFKEFGHERGMNVLEKILMDISKKHGPSQVTDKSVGPKSIPDQCALISFNSSSSGSALTVSFSTFTVAPLGLMIITLLVPTLKRVVSGVSCANSMLVKQIADKLKITFFIVVILLLFIIRFLC